jgi:hypothetical protein
MEKQTNKKSNRLPAMMGTLAVALSVGLGAFILLIVAHIGYRQAVFVAKSQFAQGTVTKVEQTESTYNGEVRTTDWPTVAFSNSAGSTVTFKPNTTWGFLHYSTGQEIDVLYLPGEPANAQIDSFVPLFGVPLLVGALGIAFIVLPFHIKKKRKREAVDA